MGYLSGLSVGYNLLDWEANHGSCRTHAPVLRTRIPSDGPGENPEEVAETTADGDRTRKIPLYALAGIREVWLVNLAFQTIEVYKAPTLTGYQDVRTDLSEEARRRILSGTARRLYGLGG